jgi:hypothetical protein
MVKGHDVGFVVNLKPLTIHHKLIAVYIHNGYRSVGMKKRGGYSPPGRQEA